MNKITIHNYEAFLLDFYEGTLTGADRLELAVFMIDHPELAVDIDDLAIYIIADEAVLYNHKCLIKKKETDLVNSNQFIAYIEHQVSQEEKAIIEKSCKANPILETELKHYLNTISQADMSVIFNNKKALKRSPKVMWFNFSASQFAAAASVAIIIFVYLFWPIKKVDVSNTLSFISPKHLQNKSSGIVKTSIIKETLTQFAAKPLLTKTLVIKSNVTAKHEVAFKLKEIDARIKEANQSNLLINNIIQKEEQIIPKQDYHLASNVVTNKTIIEVISENEEDDVQVKPKKSFWALAGKALNTLNKAGVKSVDGKESTNNDEAGYALTLGNVNITHTTH